jgi:hypothetical protein
MDSNQPTLEHSEIRSVRSVAGLSESFPHCRMLRLNFLAFVLKMEQGPSSMKHR